MGDEAGMLPKSIRPKQREIATYSTKPARVEYRLVNGDGRHWKQNSPT